MTYLYISLHTTIMKTMFQMLSCVGSNISGCYIFWIIYIITFSITEVNEADGLKKKLALLHMKFSHQTV